MNMPFRRSKSLPVRMLESAAATAGSARGLVRRRTQPVQPKSRNPLARLKRQD